MSIIIIPRLWGFSIKDDRDNSDIFFGIAENPSHIESVLSKKYSKKELSQIMAGVYLNINSWKFLKKYGKKICIKKSAS